MSIPGRSSSRVSQRSKSSRALTENRATESQTLSAYSVEAIDYKEELILYFLDEMLPYIINFSEVLDLSTMPVDKSESDVVLGKALSKLSNSKKSQTYQTRPSRYRSTTFSTLFLRKRSISSTLSKKMTPSTISLKPGCFLDWIVPKCREYVHIVFKNGNEYIGYAISKIMHGKGVFVWDEGAYYEGDFTNGKITGEGILKYSECSYYRGEFCNGMLHGIGSFYPLTTSMVYNGGWRYGKKHGKGWMLYCSGNYYDGEWVNDHKEGVGYRQYQNGTIYKGHWKNGLPEGKGRIYYYNSDIYRGDFHKGLPHGRGEYTWKAGLVRGLTLSIENRYQGMWVNGAREGLGVLHFGMEGSRLKSKFKANQKHGPGVIICGDGTIIKKNPLFFNDKVSHINTVAPTPSSISCGQSLKSFASVNTPKTGSILSLKAEASASRIKNQSKCSPLPIPVHGTAAYIDLEEHISKLILKYMIFKEDLFGQKRSSWKLALLSGNNLDVKYRQCTEVNYKFEERKLRNSILYHYQILKNLYNTYAALCGAAAKPALSRLLLWQMCRDLDFQKTGLSLIQIDLLLSTFPGSAVELKHHPFEIIYFWQFIHLILLISFEYYASLDYFVKHKDNGIYAQMLKDFVKDFVCPNFGTFKGEALFKYKDLLPIEGVFSLYKSVGMPHSARAFLRKCCVKKWEKPMCYLMPAPSESGDFVFSGTNAVCTGANFIYLPDESSDVLGTPHAICDCPFERDTFYQDLKVFRSLGPKRILRCLCQICPLIKTGRTFTNVGYELTFLEFYEVLLLLSLEYIEDKKREEENLLRESFDTEATLTKSSAASNRTKKENAMTSPKKKSKTKK